MKIYEASAVPACEFAGCCTDASSAKPGTIYTDKKSFLHICSGNGMIALNEIQLAGKKRMKIKDFLLGFRDIEKFRFI